MDVYVVTAIYGPNPVDVETLVAVGYTAEIATKTMETYIDIAGREAVNMARGPDITPDPEDWIVSDPHLMPVEGEPPKVTPPWRTDVFTDAEREIIFGMALEDVRDSVREWTQDACDQMSLAECIGYLDENNDATVELLKSIRDCTEDHFTADKEVVEFAKRFGLINEEPAVTPRGFSYLLEWD